ncbi:MAG: hypothetical protein ABR547_01790 [Halanaerobium sp.]
MLQFLFLFLIFIIFFTILLVALPYHYALYFNFDKTLKYNFAVSVLFLQLIFKGDPESKLFLIKIFSFKKEFKIAENNKVSNFIENKSKKIIEKKIKNKTVPAAEKKAEKKSKFKFDFKLINKENLKHIFKFIIEMLRILKLDYLKLKVVFSLADPYYNGLFLAYYYTLKELFNYPDLKVEINWQEVVFEANGSAGGKIIPLKIIYQILKFIFSLKSLKIFWQLYQSNSKKG